MTNLEENLNLIKQEKTEKIIPSNIKKGINILGISGIVEELSAQTKTAIPSENLQTIIPDSGYNGISSITIQPVSLSNENYNLCLDISNSILYGGEPPKPYVELEYIQSSGTQYINTGIASNTIRYLEFKFMPVKLANNYQAYLSAYPDDFTVGAYNYLTQTFLRYRGVEIYKAKAISTTTPTVIKVQNDGIYFNTQKYSRDTTWAIGTRTQNLFISATSSKTVPAAMNFYGLKLYNMNGDLISNIIPVRRITDNIICVYDTIREEFLTNSGSGNFVAGPEIEEV